MVEELVNMPWYRRHPMRALLLTMLIPAVVGAIGFCTVVLVVRNGLVNHPVYNLAAQRVSSDPVVQQELGTPIEPGWLVTGITHEEDGTRAELMMSFNGSHGGAGVRVIGREEQGQWRLTFVDVGIKQTDGRERVLTLIEEEQPKRFGDEAEFNHGGAEDAEQRKQ
jgi:hypothetical protein